MELIDHLDPTSLDPTVPVEQDFFRHVNGGWLDANPVPAEYPAWGSFFEITVRNEETLHEILISSAENPGASGTPSQMVGDYFAAGMDEESIARTGTAPLHPLLEAIDGVNDFGSLRKAAARLRQVGVAAFFGVGINPDFEDSDRYLIYIAQGGIGLPDRDYYTRDDEQSLALVAAYVDHIAAQLGNLGAGGGEEAQAIFEFEKTLANASLPTEVLRKAEVRYNRHEVETLDDLMPTFLLGQHLRDLDIEANTVNIDNADFFPSLDKAIGDTSFETLRAYLKWHLIRTYASALPTEFEDEAFDFYGRQLGGRQEQRKRWTRILTAAGSDISEQVARLYVGAAFSPEAKQRCEEMVEELLQAMERSIRNLDWMSDETKRAALTKLDSFGFKIGYPDQWRSYDGLAITRESFVANRMASAGFEFQRRLSRLDEPVDKAEWEMPAHIVNAYYHPMLNEIVFPAGILQAPIFYADADDAMNYGAIGTVIGHEITHGFDDNGSQFDAVGQRRNWWSDADREAFEARAEVLVEQFNGFQVNDDQTVNGKLTLGENIADLGGLKIAYDAFEHSLGSDDYELGGWSARQRFFLSYGTIWRMNYTDAYLRMLTNVDVHSPNPFRVRGPLSNFPQFAELFDVDEGTPMSLKTEDRAEIW